jgi:general secretion pathway protein A
MYVDYWNLKENPFLNTTDSRYLFSGDQHEEAIARFTFLAESGRQAGVLTGPYGVGKSTVLQHVAFNVEQKRIPVIRLDAIPGGQLPMARHILSRMKIDGPSGTLSEALMSFASAAESRSHHLTRVLLCIDEAHYLAADEGLYLVHYLSNLRLFNKAAGREEPFFTIILAGTPDLLQAVRSDPSLNQRMQIVFSLAPLNEVQTLAYIQEHMRTAGGDLWVFDRDALSALFRFSGGVPRRINLLCDTSLMLGFAAQVTNISAAIVEQAASDIGIVTQSESGEVLI